MNSRNHVRVGSVCIGGGAPVSIQSMTNTPTADTEATLAQIRSLEQAGCDIVRLAVCGEEDLASCRTLLKEAKAPLVADIQFDYKLAIACSDAGFAKVRFNPGNIGSEENVRKLIDVCKTNGTPIRVGVNAGSLERDLLAKYGRTAQALCESALRQTARMEKYGFYDTVISVKSSDVPTCIEAYRLLHARCDYPLHLGVTESGSGLQGLVKSSIGIGTLLGEGIGDTIRVSLTGDPVREAEAAAQILKALHLREGCEIVACPTCSRCHIPLETLYRQVEEMLAGVRLPLKIAVMGCVVNGPGEAADADFGVAGGDNGKAVVFRKGKVVKTVPAHTLLDELRAFIEQAKANQVE